MRPLITLTALILLSTLSTRLSAQTTISGSVKDSKGHPLHGASIAIKNSYDGATTDSTGAFRFVTTEKGPDTLTVSNIGYNPIQQPVTLNGTPVVLHLALKEQLSELKAVTITAGSFSAGDSKRGAVLSSLDVATTAGSNADITAALKTMLPWQIAHVEDARRELGEDWWAYGFAANRPVLETFLRYHHEQGLSPRKLGIDALFAPEALESFTI